MRARLTFDTDRPPARVTVYQDGVATDTQEVGTADMKLRVDRLRGARWIRIMAEDVAGVTSLLVTADISPDPRGRGAGHALLVGVHLYADGRLPDLDYAKADDGRPGGELRSKSITTTGIAGRRATPEAILTAARDLVAALSPDENATLFFCRSWPA